MLNSIVWLKQFVLSLTSSPCLIVLCFLLHWLSIEDFSHTAFKFSNLQLLQISPPYLHNIFQFSKDITGHVSHNINRLFVPRVFTNIIMVKGISFIDRGVVLWSNSSLSVTKATTLLSFKITLFLFAFVLYVSYVCIMHLASCVLHIIYFVWYIAK